MDLRALLSAVCRIGGDEIRPLEHRALAANHRNGTSTAFSTAVPT
jgi:hypothetical protein